MRTSRSSVSTITMLGLRFAWPNSAELGSLHRVTQMSSRLVRLEPLNPITTSEPPGRAASVWSFYCGLDPANEPRRRGTRTALGPVPAREGFRECGSRGTFLPEVRISWSVDVKMKVLFIFHLFQVENYFLSRTDENIFICRFFLSLSVFKRCFYYLNFL